MSLKVYFFSHVVTSTYRVVFDLLTGILAESDGLCHLSYAKSYSATKAE